jgi:glyoxalase family protein
MDLKGIHHLTAISARIGENRRFYTEVLGMRLVKRTVNQDDVSAYHLFYADAVGSPGTDVTFFDWPAAPERRGTHSIVRTSLRVRDEASIAYWQERLANEGVTFTRPAERDGRVTLDFEDSEGQRLALVVDGGSGDPPVPWERSPVPEEHQIRGLGPIVMSVPDLLPTDQVLQKVTSMRPVRTYLGGSTEGSDVHVYEMGPGGPSAELHVAVEPDLPAVRPGAGGVHHVAFRTPMDEYEAWAERLDELRIRNSGPVDRFYFRSLYFREPNGILFEIATDGPGFAMDEDPATLGEQVALPPFLEPQRQRIVANLKPID